MAVALDKLAPSWLASTTKGGTPHLALILSAVLGSLLLLANYSRGLIDAFAFLLKMSTSLGLIYYFVVSLAELRHSSTAPAWASVAVLGCAYSLFAAFGSGLEVLFWGVVTMAIGVPLYFILRRGGAAERAIQPS
jgi:APA family basic amino acid/polyamine antiporter